MKAEDVTVSSCVYLYIYLPPQFNFILINTKWNLIFQFLSYWLSESLIPLWTFHI